MHLKTFYPGLPRSSNDSFSTVSLGVISGGLSLIAYALTYAWLATRFRWYIALTGGFLVFAVSTTFLQMVTFPLIPIFLAVCSAIVVGLRLMPNDAVEEGDTQPDPWDIPSRILIGTSFISVLNWECIVYRFPC